MISRLFIIITAVILFSYTISAEADQRQDPREQAISDTLDLWREGRFEQLYSNLSHRNGMTKESFIEHYTSSQAKPACCHMKLNNFKLLNEKRTTARVYATIAMEGVPNANATQSREFTLDCEGGVWKMRLADIKQLAGNSRSKRTSTSHRSHH